MLQKYQPVRLWVGQMVAGGQEAYQWFHLGSDLPDQGQASETNDLCGLLYTVGPTFRDHLQFCIYIT